MADKNGKSDLMEKLVSLCKRRGYIFQSSEIYGGINSCYDFGPLGVEMKNNVKRLWWETMTLNHDDIEGLDSGILMHPKIWMASGHVEGFTDPLVDCKKCKQRFKSEEGIGKKCPNCGGELTDSRKFNLMFKTFMGPVEDEASIVYLRPETAQGIYVNFLNVQASARRKIPFGIAQIGKAFRNEITPGNFIFRTREFEQMEMQFFVKPGTDSEWFTKWREERLEWYKNLGLNKDKLMFHDHTEKELAHYAKMATDIQYEFPFGWQEIEGIHNRTDFDLKRHTEFSKKNMAYFDEESKERYIPYIIETSAGCDRSCLCFLVNAYAEEADRVVLKLHPKIAPIKAAIFPLVNKEGLDDIAKDIYNKLKVNFKVFYDESGSIGRRYRRQDEAGTPFCITIDADTKTNETVTLRDRDSMKQEKVRVSDLLAELKKRLV
jgi:glycyl-tRNA synthetase